MAVVCVPQPVSFPVPTLYLNNTQILDVRPRVEFGIGALPMSVNLPFLELERCSDEEAVQRGRVALNALGVDEGADPSRRDKDAVVVVCRRGNDSQRATLLLQRLALSGNLPPVKLCDLAGGLRAWAQKADPEFPMY